MIENRIRNIQERITRSERIPDETRKELLALLDALHREVTALPESRQDDADSITRFAEASTHEATRATAKPQLLNAAIDGLKGSVEDFEVSHPQLADTLNRIAVILANMGI